MRRALLAFVTALLVARPLVLGEDPGLINRLSNPSGLLLSMLWFVAAVLWAAARARFRLRSRPFGLIEIGLAAVAALAFVSALGAAHYRHPALIIAWEWVVSLLAFGLVRQLAVTPAEVRTLIAALLATGVGLGVHAIFQSASELPERRQQFSDLVRQREEGTKPPGPRPQNEVRLEVLRERTEMDNASATYAHPNSLASYLALVLLPATGWVLTSWRHGARRPRLVLTAGCVLLLGVGLALTHSRGGMLAVVVVGMAAMLLSAWPFWRTHWRWVAVGLVLMAGGLVAFGQSSRGRYLLERAGQSFSVRTQYWAATRAMIADHPWLGVGPGNFGRHYPRYMTPSSYEKVQDPHNFLLEVGATCGVFAVLALLATLGVWVVRCGWSVVRARATTPENPEPAPRWEFWVGGVAGLALGSLVRAGDVAAANLVREALVSGGRALLWCAAFALFLRLPWPPRARALAVTAGVAAMLLNLCVSGGIVFPSVAQPLWAMAALALTASEQARGVAPASAAHAARGWPTALLPLPLLGSLGLAYLLLVFLPATRCAAALARARLNFGDTAAEPGWRNSVVPQLEEQRKGGSREQLSQEFRRAGGYLARHILEPLEEAAQADPGDSIPAVDLAYWYQERLRLFGDPREAYDQASQQALRAQRLDPDGKEGFLAEYQLHRRMAQRSRGEEREQLGLAVRAFQAVVDRDPTDAYSHFEMANLLFQLGDQGQARAHATVARDLDLQAPSAERGLTAGQREQLGRWLDEARP